jgi:hypothetical protein
MGQDPNATSLDVCNVLELFDTIWIPTGADSAPLQQPPVQTFDDMSGIGLRYKERTELILARAFGNSTSNDTAMIHPNPAAFESSRLNGNWCEAEREEYRR